MEGDSPSRFLFLVLYFLFFISFRFVFADAGVGGGLRYAHGNGIPRWFPFSLFLSRGP